MSGFVDRIFSHIAPRVNRILEGAVVCFRKTFFEKSITTALAIQAPCQPFSMSNGLLYRISIMMQRRNATTMISVKVVHIKAPTSLYSYSLVINGITGIIKVDKQKTLWLFGLLFENYRSEVDERLRRWSTLAIKNNDISPMR